MTRGANLAAVTVSLAEYHHRLAQSGSKLELCEGLIVDAAGGSRAHNDLAVNLTVLLAAAPSWRPVSSEWERRPGRPRRIRLPRVSGRDRHVRRAPHLPGETDTLANPTVVVEVTSPSSEAFDRGKKFAHYRAIASFREYLLVSHQTPMVEIFTRSTGSAWILRGYGPGEHFVLLDASFAVDDVYRAVALEG